MAKKQFYRLTKIRYAILKAVKANETVSIYPEKSIRACILNGLITLNHRTHIFELTPLGKTIMAQEPFEILGTVIIRVPVEDNQ